MNSILKNMAIQANGSISVGVLGPVRSGKSTFVNNFMQRVVVPRIANDNDIDRCVKDVPQIFDGNSIVTVYPQYIPQKSVGISVDGKNIAGVQLLDGVGWPVNGAEGYLDGNSPRKITTPWYNETVDFDLGAKICCQKITETSTFLIVVTTDGSFVNIPRENYAIAEEKCISQLKEIGKPFVLLFNTTMPTTEATQVSCKMLQDKHGITVLPMDVANAREEDYARLFAEILKQFPIRRIAVDLPKWMRALPQDCKALTQIIDKLKECSCKISKLKDADYVCDNFNCDYICNTKVSSIDCGNSTISYNLEPSKDLFFQVLTEEVNVDIADECSLLRYVTQCSHAKMQYEIFKDAIAEADVNGYGVVYPLVQNLALDEPQMIKQGGVYGVKLTAKAPSYHIIKVDVTTDVSPMVGTEQQSQYLIDEYKTNPQKIWNTNMFGRTMSGIANDGLAIKSASMPVEVKQKLTRTVNKIVNENRGGVICILL